MSYLCVYKSVIKEGKTLVIINKKVMNRIVVAILVTLCLQSCGVQEEKVILEKPTVDKRVELLSIVFRLAENPEYSSKVFELYTERIEQYFEKYKNHELIQFAKSIANEHWISYDAVMSMAIHLDDNLKLLTDVNDIWDREARWSKENAEKFVLLLQQFAKDTEFDIFFNDNADLYAETIKRFDPVYEQLDLNWYLTFYGKEPLEKFLILIGAGNGGNSYGPSLDYTNGNRTVYAIMGLWSIDNEGMPVFDTSYFYVLLHEFNHPFVNYLTEKNKDALRESGEQIFSVLGNQVQYTSWQTVLDEALVRAAVIKYMKDHHAEQSIIADLIKQEKIDNGYLWIEELIDELESYDKQRDKYPSLESYMPQLVEAYKIWSANILSVEDKKPEVISISEFTNESLNVSPDIQTITINFNMPLLAGNRNYLFPGSKGQNAFPKFEEINYANNNQSITIQVNLEKDREYQFVLSGRFFKSVDGIGIKNYEVNFKTAK